MSKSKPVTISINHDIARMTDNTKNRSESMSDHKTSQTALAQGMTDEILEVIYRYHEAVPVVLVLGVLEVIKQQLIVEHTEVEEDE